MRSPYVKHRVDVTSDGWTPLQPVQAQDFFSFRCPTSDIVFRTDIDDAATEDTLPAGMQEGVVSGAGSQPGSSAFYYTQVRFQAGKTICWLKSVQPTATVIVTWA